MLRTYIAIVAFLIALPLCTIAQNEPLPQEKSLADIARENKARAKSAKVVVDEDSTGLRKHSTMLPLIPGDGLDNSGDILKAIMEYKKAHTPEETEQLVHDWYDDYDVTFKQLAAENTRIENAQPPAIRTQHEYQLAVQQRQLDLQRQKQNAQQMARIQGMFVKLRLSLQQNSMNWEWFKIRCNGVNCIF